MTSTGSGNLPKYAYHLGIVDDADELARGRGQNFLPRQCAAAALDQVEMLVGLVRPIHIEVQVSCLRQFRDFETEFLEACPGRFRACNDSADFRAYLWQRVDEVIDRGACTYAELTAVLYVVKGCQGCKAFFFRLMHWATLPLRCCGIIHSRQQCNRALFLLHLPEKNVPALGGHTPDYRLIGGRKISLSLAASFLS